MACPLCKQVSPERRRSALEACVRRFNELVEAAPRERMQPIVDALMAIDPTIVEALGAVALEAYELHEIVTSVRPAEPFN
jgi:hypothetical protein